MKVMTSYEQSKKAWFGNVPCMWWFSVYISASEKFMVMSVTKPTARQLRRWKKQARQGWVTP